MSRFDIRTAGSKQSASTAVGPGDVGTHDSLGDPSRVRAGNDVPGRRRALGDVEYLYACGDPPRIRSRGFPREVRREPNAPEGYLARSWFDALGRSGSRATSRTSSIRRSADRARGRAPPHTGQSSMPVRPSRRRRRASTCRSRRPPERPRWDGYVLTAISQATSIPPAAYSRRRASTAAARAPTTSADAAAGRRRGSGSTSGNHTVEILGAHGHTVRRQSLHG
jgi:hypothetical protein